MHCLGGLCSFCLPPDSSQSLFDIFFRCKIPRSTLWLSWPPRESPACHSVWTSCFRACPAASSLHKYQALGVSTARKLLPPTGSISARDTVSIATQGFLFFWWTVSKNRKSTSGVAVSAVPTPPPSLPESTRGSTLGLAGSGLNIPGGRMRATEVCKREKCSTVYAWFKGGFVLVTLLPSYEGLYAGTAQPHQPAVYCLLVIGVAEHLSRTNFCISHFYTRVSKCPWFKCTCLRG